jgi:hypothetical protein
MANETQLHKIDVDETGSRGLFGNVTEISGLAVTGLSWIAPS